MTTKITMYQYSVIYRVWCYESKKSYVAYTCNKNKSVRSGFVSLKQNKKLSPEAYKIVHSNYARFKLIKYFPCKTLNELLLEIDDIIKTIDCVNKPLSDFDRKIMTKYKWNSRREYNAKYHRAYYHMNKKKFNNEKALLRNKRYRERNNFYVKCEICGSIYQNLYTTKHILTKKHLKAFESPENIPRPKVR